MAKRKAKGGQDGRSAGRKTLTPEEEEKQAIARRLRGQKAAATRAANEAKREADEARAAAKKAKEEFTRLKAQEPQIYRDYEKALRAAMTAKGDDFARAWRKVESLQQRCVNVSAKLRSAA